MPYLAKRDTCVYTVYGLASFSGQTILLTWAWAGSLTSVVCLLPSGMQMDFLWGQEIKLDDHNDPSDFIFCESCPQMQVNLIIALIWEEKKEQMPNTNFWKVILFSL